MEWKKWRFIAMPTIQVLDQNTINQIAAGEVIERPASVVKELLENAIDAKATAITIEIKEGGISFIRITDNGCGIAKEEIPLAFLRHSTSKIRTVEDLITVSSLGFRGEALSSIAAVSQVELITKLSSSLNGSRYCMEGGTEKSLEEIGCPDGTTFLIRNLFYNTPARRKFLRTAQTEAGYISDMVEKIALSHSEVSIRFINNNQSRLHTSGNCNLKDIIYCIYGRDIAMNLLPVQASIEHVSVCGFIGDPIISRGNRAYENYYVNGRYIKSVIISKAIEDAYQNFLMQHRYPFTVLHLQINSELLDVNVHPTKMDLRIRNADTVYSFLYETISGILSSKEWIPEVFLEKKEEVPKTERKKETTNRSKNKKEFEKEFPKQLEKKTALPTEPLKPERNQSTKEREIRETASYDVRPLNQTDVAKEMPEIQRSLFDGKLLAKEAREHLRMIGQVFDTYWLVEYQNQLFFIDQHAAHEKVLYEKIINRLKKREYASQIVNPPIVLTLSMREEELLVRFRSSFEEMGFEIEHFGGKEYAIRAVPDNLLGLAQKEIFLEMLDELSDEIQLQNLQSIPAIEEKVAAMSCKAAVKGHFRLSVQEAEELIGDLMQLENPYRCPHGRPTILEMSKYEIEKKFKRV